jgi:hypothetical protein
VLSLWRNNHPGDIVTARRLAKVTFTLPDQYAHAVFAFSSSPSRSGGKKQKIPKDTFEPPHGFRISDVYAERLIKLAPEVANMVRTVDPNRLPKGVNKTKEVVMKWL